MNLSILRPKTFIETVDTCKKHFWKSFVVKLSRLMSPKLAIAKKMKPEYFKA